MCGTRSQNAGILWFLFLFASVVVEWDLSGGVLAVHMYMYIYVYACVHMYMYIYVYACVYMYMYIYVYACVYMPTCISVRILIVQIICTYQQYKLLVRGTNYYNTVLVLSTIIQY
jgi:hypothetical protein